MVNDDEIMTAAEAHALLRECGGSLDADTVVRVLRTIVALQAAIAAAEHRADVQREVAEALADGALARPAAEAAE